MANYLKNRVAFEFGGKVVGGEGNTGTDSCLRVDTGKVAPFLLNDRKNTIVSFNQDGQVALINSQKIIAQTNVNEAMAIEEKTGGTLYLAKEGDAATSTISKNKLRRFGGKITSVGEYAQISNPDLIFKDGLQYNDKTASSGVRHLLLPVGVKIKTSQGRIINGHGRYVMLEKGETVDKFWKLVTKALYWIGGKLWGWGKDKIKEIVQEKVTQVEEKIDVFFENGSKKTYRHNLIKNYSDTDTGSTLANAIDAFSEGAQCVVGASFFSESKSKDEMLLFEVKDTQFNLGKQNVDGSFAQENVEFSGYSVTGEENLLDLYAEAQDKFVFLLDKNDSKNICIYNGTSGTAYVEYNVVSNLLSTKVNDKTYSLAVVEKDAVKHIAISNNFGSITYIAINSNIDIGKGCFINIIGTKDSGFFLVIGGGTREDGSKCKKLYSAALPSEDIGNLSFSEQSLELITPVSEITSERVEMGGDESDKLILIGGNDESSVDDDSFRNNDMMVVTLDSNNNLFLEKYVSLDSGTANPFTCVTDIPVGEDGSGGAKKTLIIDGGEGNLKAIDNIEVVEGKQPLIGTGCVERTDVFVIEDQLIQNDEQVIEYSAHLNLIAGNGIEVDRKDGITRISASGIKEFKIDNISVEENDEYVGYKSIIIPYDCRGAKRIDIVPDFSDIEKEDNYFLSKMAKICSVHEKILFSFADEDKFVILFDKNVEQALVLKAKLLVSY